MWSPFQQQIRILVRETGPAPVPGHGQPQHSVIVQGMGSLDPLNGWETYPVVIATDMPKVRESYKRLKRVYPGFYIGNELE